MAQPLPWASLGLCLLKLPKEMAPLQAMASQVLTAEETAFKNGRLYVSRKLSVSSRLSNSSAYSCS